MKRRSEHSSSVALVLSSGGARGLAHIGVIQDLVARGYRIRSIAGSSMGAVVGGLYAVGKLEEYENWIRGFDKLDILRMIDFTLSDEGFIKGERVFEQMRKLDMIPDIRIEELPLPYTAVAVDLNAPFPYSPHFPPGSEREHSMEAHLKGSPNQRIRSLLQKWDEMFGHRLPGKEKIGYFDLIMRSVQLMQHRLTTYALARTPPDVLIQISKDCATVFEFYRAEELIQYGRVVCAEALDRFEESQGRGGSV